MWSFLGFQWTANTKPIPSNFQWFKSYPSLKKWFVFITDDISISPLSKLVRRSEAGGHEWQSVEILIRTCLQWLHQPQLTEILVLSEVICYNSNSLCWGEEHLIMDSIRNTLFPGAGGTDSAAADGVPWWMKYVTKVAAIAAAIGNDLANGDD